jgi:hypothetical protein
MVTPMSDGTSGQQSGLTRGLSFLRSLGDVVRIWGVLAIALLAVSQPARVRSWVRDAGIKKLLDVEFSEADAKKIEATQQDLKDSRLVIANLGEKLEEAQRHAPAELARDLEMAAQVAQSTSQQLGDALEKVSPLAKKAAVVTGPATGEWAVIFGGDATLDGARWEVERAAEKLEPDRERLAIFLRDGSYRSVARYDTKEEATDALERFKKLRASAYVIPLGQWCGKRTRDGDVFRCS